MAAVRDERFDVVVLDFWLSADQPEHRMTGVTLYHELTRIDPGLAKRVIFVTGDPSEPTQKRLKHIAATYLLKPFEIGLLVNALRERLVTEGLRVGESIGDGHTRSA